MKFREKGGREVDAFHMTAEMVNNWSAWPEWLRDHWSVRPGEGIVTVVFAGREGNRVVSVGDWLVLDPTGALLLYQDFASYYEPIGDGSPDVGA